MIAPPQTITICLVEDDVELSESVARYVDGTPGFRCLGAYASGEVALVEIPRQHPAVVLMDINLPGMSGIECVAQLRGTMPALLVIMLTVYEDTDQVFKSLAAGAVGYLVKSTKPSHLLDAIREVQQGGSPMSSHIARKVVQAFQPVSQVQPAGAQFSPREAQVLELLAKGDPYKQIADSMGISIETIRTYIRRIYEKLHVHSRIEAVVKYMGSRDHPQGPRPGTGS
jgi:DNA-binding NarL/FixJ family response regulator